MINSVYGKTMENLRINVRIVNDEKDVSKPTGISQKIFDIYYATIH